jgi:Sec-independent protein translocase protein TatA
LGFAEIILIAVLALIFIGPKQLPEVARLIARALNEWKRYSQEFTASFRDLRTDLHHNIESTSPPPVDPVEPHKETTT